ncbi:MAG TPA: FAD binding domain-containing protein [Opitutaceae bacterium]|nr:FAD binding domain-containing protein [Opitutaceae bacterium]
MNAFAYVTAQTPKSAVELAGDDGRFLAGGVDLLGRIEEGLDEPKLLVNIKALPGTTDLTPGPDKWVIGANVKLAALAGHPDLARVFPALAAAAAHVGSPQMRNLATVGGNLAQHVRCWYYRHHDVVCLKKGGHRCFARSGENKYHSLFTAAMCASPCVSNLGVTLTALGASVVVQHPAHTVTLAMADLYSSAWRNPRVHNSLHQGDLILRVEIPVPAGGRSVYLQMSEKAEFDWALVSCAAAARVDGRKLSGARIVLGAVAPIPWELDEANALLENSEVTDDLASLVANRLLEKATPLARNAYKIPLAQALIRRALHQLVA